MRNFVKVRVPFAWNRIRIQISPRFIPWVKKKKKKKQETGRNSNVCKSIPCDIFNKLSLSLSLSLSLWFVVCLETMCVCLRFPLLVVDSGNVKARNKLGGWDEGRVEDRGRRQTFGVNVRNPTWGYNVRSTVRTSLTDLRNRRLT